MRTVPLMKEAQVASLLHHKLQYLLHVGKLSLAELLTQLNLCIRKLWQLPGDVFTKKGAPNLHPTQISLCPVNVERLHPLPPCIADILGRRLGLLGLLIDLALSCYGLETQPLHTALELGEKRPIEETMRQAQLTKPRLPSLQSGVLIKFLEDFAKRGLIQMKELNDPIEFFVKGVDAPQHLVRIDCSRRLRRGLARRVGRSGRFHPVLQTLHMCQRP
mmetsp:Transcript_4325/g.9755  ORF Transcript_4325/g.9755 Transcript_4325/m.9755 type:complete len:218 (-) Transcript_4325:695-1348(-)